MKLRPVTKLLAALALMCVGVWVGSLWVAAGAWVAPGAGRAFAVFTERGVVGVAILPSDHSLEPVGGTWEMVYEGDEFVLLREEYDRAWQFGFQRNSYSTAYYMPYWPLLVVLGAAVMTQVRKRRGKPAG